MTWAELTELEDDGHEIADHSMNHANVASLDASGLAREVEPLIGAPAAASWRLGRGPSCTRSEDGIGKRSTRCERRTTGSPTPRPTARHAGRPSRFTAPRIRISRSDTPGGVLAKVARRTTDLVSGLPGAPGSGAAWLAVRRLRAAPDRGRWARLWVVGRLCTDRPARRPLERNPNGVQRPEPTQPVRSPQPTGAPVTTPNTVAGGVRVGAVGGAARGLPHRQLRVDVRGPARQRRFGVVRDEQRHADDPGASTTGSLLLIGQPRPGVRARHPHHAHRADRRPGALLRVRAAQRA